MELDFESLFADCLSGLVEECGGSIETALDQLTYDEEERQAIKEWFGWDDEEDYDEDEEDE